MTSWPWRRASRILARTGAIASGVMLLLSSWAALSATGSPAKASPAAGSVQVVTPISTSGGGDPLNAGGSTTAFTLKLPSGAACSGDSANDGFRWQTYMAPVAVDPAGLTFDNTGPVPNGLGASFRQPLYDPAGSPAINMQTANAATPPGPGPILNVPDFNYAVYSSGDVPAGEYGIGIACTHGPPSATQLDRYWNVKVTFTASASDPIGVTWAVSTPTTTSSSTSTSTTSTTVGSTSTSSTSSSTSSTTSSSTSSTSTSSTSTSSSSSTSSTTPALTTPTSSTSTSSTSTSTTTSTTTTPTTVAESSTSSSIAGGDSTTSSVVDATSTTTTVDPPGPIPSGTLARTGMESWIAVWAGLFVLFGTAAVRLGRE